MRVSKNSSKKEVFKQYKFASGNKKISNKQINLTPKAARERKINKLKVSTRKETTVNQLNSKYYF